MTPYEARQAMTKARQEFGMLSPEAVAAERAVYDAERQHTAARKDQRDPVLRQFQD